MERNPLSEGDLSPRVNASRSWGPGAVVAIIALVLLMGYSIILLTLGHSLEITLTAAAVLSGLAVELVRRTLLASSSEAAPRPASELAADVARTVQAGLGAEPQAGLGAKPDPAAGR